VFVSRAKDENFWFQHCVEHGCERDSVVTAWTVRNHVTT
jgi:hypothetical protein